MTKSNDVNVKFDNPKILSNIVKGLSSIIDETNLSITPDAFSVKAMDPSRICLLELIIKKENFDVYNCNTELVIGIHLEDFSKILKRAGASDTIEIIYSEADQKIRIKVQPEDGNRIRTFSLACLDLDIEEPSMENLKSKEYPSIWNLDPEILIESLKDAEIYSEIINIKATEGIGLTISSIGQIGEMEYQLGIDEFLEIELDKTQSGAYAILFLKSIMKLKPIIERLKVSLLTDYPLKMEIFLIEGGQLEFYLAPRVEESNFDEEDESLEEIGKL
jgi:proliferating cell nuclear antigen